MRYVNILAVTLLLILLVPTSALSTSLSDMDDLLEDRIAWAESEGCEVFFSETSEITLSPNVSYFFELEAGYYMFIADGGDGILDLDMYVYDEPGYELASDVLNDNYPICEFTLTSPAEVYIEVTVYEFAKGVTSDYFNIVASGEVSSSDKGADGDTGIVTDDLLDYWESWAQDQGYQILYTDNGVLNRDGVDTFELDLERGNYEIVVETINEIDDVDLFIYDASGRELISDQAADNYPICSFELRTAQTVIAEVVPISYARGNNTDYIIILSAEGGGVAHGFPTIENFDRNEVIDAEADAVFIDNLLGDYMDMIIDKGFQNMYDETGIIGQGEAAVIPITLGRGTYMVYGHAGLRILDIDMRVYDEDGFIVAEDTLINDSPLCEFSVQVGGQYEIEIDCYEMVTPWAVGDYLVVIARK